MICSTLRKSRDSFLILVQYRGPRMANGTAISLNEDLEKPQVAYGYKFIDGNVGVSGKKITLPHYMAMFL